LKRIILTIFLILPLPGCSFLMKDCEKMVSSHSFEEVRLCRASQGHQQSQYQIGLEAFSNRDYQEAVKWLERAAASSSGRSPVYLPAVGSQTYGTVMMMDTGQPRTAHKGALSLLAIIYDQGLGVEKDPKKARKYRIEAE